MTHTISKDLLAYISGIYIKCGFTLSQFKAEEESDAYDACTFKLNDYTVIFRTAKTTPTKPGQFVTVWKRSAKGPIAPFDIYDNFDFIIINSVKGDKVGQFIFSKKVLVEQGIISGNNKQGKRGIRVYPPWEQVNNNTALKTQSWQSEFFVDMCESDRIASKSFMSLLFINK